MVDPWTAVILGIVEGITEFLPVSSTGHLIVAGHLLDFTGEKASCFEVFIQLGAILAVVCLYYNRFIALIPWRTQQSANPAGFAGYRGLMLLAVTTLPALVIGYFAHRAIKAYLFGPMTVAWALGIGGIGILLAEKYKPDSHLEDLDGLTYRQALVVGLFQCLAMWPGMSRSADDSTGGP